MRAVEKQKQPLHVGGRGFSAAKNLQIEKVSSIDGLFEVWRGNNSATAILHTAKKLNIGLDRLGNSSEEINENIGRASFKLSRKDRGYCEPIYAVSSMIIAHNDLDTAKWLITEMSSNIDEKNVKKHLTNISNIMDAAKEFGLTTKQLGSISSESTADEIIRVATNPKHKYPKNGVVMVMIGQKAENLVDVVLKNIIEKCTGSELFDLGSSIRGRVHKRRISVENAEILLKAIEKRIDRLWMAPSEP